MVEAIAIHLQTTDGEIAVINLESARRRSWNRFFADPLRKGVAETVVEQEQLTAQFVGDVQALDRLEALVGQLVQLDAASARAALIQAQVAAMMHRFADARYLLAQADIGGALSADVNRVLLNVDQACGANLGKVLDERREIARRFGRTEDLVALGGLLADLREFTDAERIYGQALEAYRDVSPFPVAWVCFQLGMLWGELVPEPQTAQAARWYRTAIDCLPSYTKARVHLAEIYSSSGRANDAEVLLIPAISSGDPEVRWRLADTLVSQKRYAEAGMHMQAARFGFEALLERHLLAFADHGAEFYAGSGDDCRRALDLARVNVSNRPTLRAFERAHDMAVNAGDPEAASQVLAEATVRWGSATAFRSSHLAKSHSEEWEGEAAW
jgi:tetratricopeptide (TPR) repeat protein